MMTQHRKDENIKNHPNVFYRQTPQRQTTRQINQTDGQINKEGIVLFNDTLNTFYIRLYGVGHMVNDRSDSERGNPLLPHGLLFRLEASVRLHAPLHNHNSIYHGICYTGHGALTGTRKSSMGDKQGDRKKHRPAGKKRKIVYHLFIILKLLLLLLLLQQQNIIILL